ncbi:MAG: four helix bundle protein [Flavobacteriales bacterium]|nr:four helix bundle protein [Flavobacteriales bacterium]
MKKSTSFKELIVWQKAHIFVLSVYKCSEQFPKSEMYGLTSQFRRASVSIAANIAEGYKKKGIKDKLRFFNIAQGSLEECRYYIILSNDLKYINNANELNNEIEEASKLLNAYSRSILNSLTP